jgi:hypothetical protein
LSAPGPKCCLRVKDYGKAKIYFSDQSILPAPDPNSLRILHDELNNLTETFREKQEFEAQLKADGMRLHSEPSDSLIDRFPFFFVRVLLTPLLLSSSEIEILATEVAEKTSRLNRLLELSSTSSSSTGLASDLSRERIVAVETFNFYRNAWKTRKEKAVDIVDMMCEGGLGKNRKDTMVCLSVLPPSSLPLRQSLVLRLMKMKESHCQRCYLLLNLPLLPTIRHSLSRCFF